MRQTDRRTSSCTVSSTVSHVCDRRPIAWRAHLRVIGCRVLTAPVRSGLLVVIAALSFSCGGDAGTQASAWADRIKRLPNGAVVVLNPSSGVWDQQGRWRLEETLRIGTAEGSGPHVFGKIAALDVDSAGRIYVFDGFARELRVFGPDGDFLTKFGRRGAGPGEFEAVVGMSLSPDGAIWLVDSQNARYTAIHGDALETYRRASSVYRLPWLGGFTADGVLYDAVLLIGQANYLEALLQIDRGGNVTDTFFIATPELPAVPRLGRISFPLPYAPRVIRTFDRRGFVWTAVTHQYQLVKVSLQGDTSLVVRRDFDAPALTGSQQDSIRRYMRHLETEFGVTVRGDMVPSAAPILRSFFVDDSGFVWVCLANRDRCSSLDIFDDRGLFLGEVELPFTMRSGMQAVVRQDNLYAIADGDLGVPVVIRARIRRQ